MPRVTTKVVDKGAERLFRAFASIPEGEEAVAGWPSSTVGSDLGTSIAEYMAINNEGAPNVPIPARPFMDHAWERNLGKYSAHFDRGMERIIRGTASPRRLLFEAAVESHNDIKRSILTGPWVGNAESTKLAKRGSTRPLVDTGAALQSCTFAVRPKR